MMCYPYFQMDESSSEEESEDEDGEGDLTE